MSSGERCRPRRTAVSASGHHDGVPSRMFLHFGRRPPLRRCRCGSAGVGEAVGPSSPAGCRRCHGRRRRSRPTRAAGKPTCRELLFGATDTADAGNDPGPATRRSHDRIVATRPRAPDQPQPLSGAMMQWTFGSTRFPQQRGPYRQVPAASVDGLRRFHAGHQEFRAGAPRHGRRPGERGSRNNGPRCASRRCRRAAPVRLGGAVSGIVVGRVLGEVPDEQTRISTTAVTSDHPRSRIGPGQLRRRGPPSPPW